MSAVSPITEREEKLGDDSLVEFCVKLEPPEWVQEGAYEKCLNCQDKFTYGGKHHCRLCGQMYCSRCSHKFVVPDPFKKKNKKGAARVCYGCEEICRRVGKSAVRSWSMKGQQKLDKDQGKQHLIYLPIWEPAHTFKDCPKCKKRGKGHNCRGCGRVYCSNCTVKLDVPEAFRIKK